ncbi:MAG: hypothetical protein RLZZ450_5727 [Pseudomonadota bacterium]|jgi:hypothetical protein
MKKAIATFVLSLAAFAAALGTTGSAAALATFDVNFLDAPGEGFFDTTPFTPSHGNPAHTLGEARRIAFKHAAFLWGSRIRSRAKIKIDAKLDPLFCTATSATLGQAGANTVHRDFPGAPLVNTWYPQALANALASATTPMAIDMDPASADISATFNSDLDNAACLGSSGWSYGLDGATVAGQFDFVSVLMHELGHGLGFQTFEDVATGAKLAGFDDAYLRLLENHGASPANFTAMSDAQRVAGNLSDPNLHWLGGAVNALAPSVLTAGIGSGHVRLHGPNPAVIGSSVSHFSTALTPNESMEPSYTVPNHNPGLALQLLQDIGWELESTDGVDVVFIMDVTGSTGALLPNWVAQIPAIAQSWLAAKPNARFAVVSHADFPFAPYGNAGDYGYRVETTFNSSIPNLTSALSLLT